MYQHWLGGQMVRAQDEPAILAVTVASWPFAASVSLA